jgi:hypothetical protein
MRINRLELSYILPVFFNQNNAVVLYELLARYASYSSELISKIQFIIVDDCSPVSITVPSSINLNYRILRIDTAIDWNQGGARNLGVVYAPSPKIILTDCDHIFPEILLRKILKSRIPRRTVYRFRREDAHSRRIKSAFNIFYTSKSVFFSTLGYDEEFCGFYGYEDQFFRELQLKIGNKISRFSLRHRIISPDIDREHSYHSLERDTCRNKKLMEWKLHLLNTNEPFSSHSRLFLNFSFRKYEEHWMDY